MKKKLEYNLSTPSSQPVWWIIKPIEEIALKDINEGLFPSTSYVLTKLWYDARQIGATELGLEHHQVVCALI